MIRTYAAADIGSNTAHMLVAATDGEIVMRIDNVNEWIALGEVVARKGEIPKEHADQLVLAMKEFRRVSESKKVRKLYVFATEAMRIASNHVEVLKRIDKEAGVKVEIISSDKEAEFSFRGVQLDTRNYEPSLMIEVGGGSAQIAEVNGDQMGQRCSLKLGSGRIIAESNLMNPCTEMALKAAQRYIRSELQRCELKHEGGIAVLSGGVARGLWRAIHPDGEKVIHKYEIEYLLRSVKDLPVDRIISRFSVKQKRAGTLLPGSLVYLELMKHFHIDTVVVSEFGVREGAVLEMAKK